MVLRIAWYWYVRIREKVFLILSWTMGIFSALIVIGEILNFTSVLESVFYTLIPNSSSYI